MKLKRACIFCGSAFTGQATNFEHVIPEWLVKEADLTKRASRVSIGARSFDAPLKRIGAKVCKACNDERAKLESLAKQVYEKIRDGAPLSRMDGHVLLDWLDKVRVGMWLWARSADPRSGFIPKFHINQRMANSDRIAMVARYPLDRVGKGMLFYGQDESFLWAPSVFGFLANNIAFFSVSSDYILLRHLRNVRFDRFLLDNDHQEATITRTLTTEPKIQILGNPLVIGQCIMDEDVFTDMSIALNTVGTKNRKGQSEVMRLSTSLINESADIGVAPLVETNIAAHIQLMELNGARASRYLFRDYLNVDFSKLSDARHRRGAIATARYFEAMKSAQIDDMVRDYQRLTGIRLLTT